MASTTQSHGAPGPGPPDCHVGAANSAVATAVAVAWTRRTGTTTPCPVVVRPPCSGAPSLALAPSLSLRRSPSPLGRSRQPAAHRAERVRRRCPPHRARITARRSHPLAKYAAFSPFFFLPVAPLRGLHHALHRRHPIRIATGQQLTPWTTASASPGAGRGPISTPRRHRNVPPLRPAVVGVGAAAPGVRRGRARRRSVSPPAMPAAPLSLSPGIC